MCGTTVGIVGWSGVDVGTWATGVAGRLQALSNKETVNKKKQLGLVTGHLQNDGGKNGMSIGAKSKTNKSGRNTRLLDVPFTSKYRLLHLSRAEIDPSFLQLFPVVPDRKQNLPIEILLSRQILSLFKMITFICRECFATPVSLSFVPGSRATFRLSFKTTARRSNQVQSSALGLLLLAPTSSGHSCAQSA